MKKREYILVTNKKRMFKLFLTIEKKFGRDEKILSYTLEDFKYLGVDNQKDLRILNVTENTHIKYTSQLAPRPLSDFFPTLNTQPFDDIKNDEYVIEVFLKIGPIPFK